MGFARRPVHLSNSGVKSVKRQPALLQHTEGKGAGGGVEEEAVQCPGPAETSGEAVPMGAADGEDRLSP